MSNTNGSSTSFFRIPGNIKMQMLPFVLNPGAKAFVQKNTEDGLQQVETSQDINITSNVLKSSDLNNKSIQPQIFSFKNVNKHYDNCYAKAQLNFLPSTFNRLNNDISFKMLYDNYSRHGSHSNDYNASLANVTIDTILDTIPSVQIREFLPDTFLDQLMNFFSNFLNLFGKKEDSSTPVVSDNSSSSATSGIIDKLASLLPGEADTRLVNVINGLLSYLAGDVTVNGQTLAETLGDGTDLDNWYTIKGKDKKLTSFIQNLPFLIYNCLQSTTTTNIYELPGYPIDKLAYSSDSSAGWADNSI